MKKIITGATILTGAIAMANDGGATANTTKKETKVEKDPIYRVIPKGSKVSVKGKKIIIENGNSMCSADKALTKATEGKTLRDIKCNISKSDPNYNFWKKISRMKNLRVYDKWTQEEIMKKIKDIETKDEESRTKVDDVEGAGRVYFDMAVIQPKKKATEVKKDVAKKEDKRVEKREVRKSEPKSKLFTKKKTEEKDHKKEEVAPKVKKRVIYIKEEISKKPTDKKEAKSNDDVDVDAIIKGIAERIAKES